MRLLDGVDFSGLGAAAKKEKPEVPPPLPTPITQVSRSSFPTWLPYGVGVAGVGIVIILLLTSKGKN